LPFAVSDGFILHKLQKKQALIENRLVISYFEDNQGDPMIVSVMKRSLFPLFVLHAIAAASTIKGIVRNNNGEQQSGKRIDVLPGKNCINIIKDLL
jgi:hypothetical protein